jgi:hypothetical protein
MVICRLNCVYVTASSLHSRNDKMSTCHLQATTSPAFSLIVTVADSKTFAFADHNSRFCINNRPALGFPPQRGCLLSMNPTECVYVLHYCRNAVTKFRIRFTRMPPGPSFLVPMNDLTIDGSRKRTRAESKQESGMITSETHTTTTSDL